MEGNSKWVIDLLLLEHRLDDDLVVADCKSILRRMSVVKISHIYREGNMGADFMANRACSLDAITSWEDNFLDELICLTMRDSYAPFMWL